MSATSRLFLICCVVSGTGCSSKSEDIFSPSCPNGEAVLPDGGCSPSPPPSGGASGTGGTSTGGRSATGGVGMTTGGRGATGGVGMTTGGAGATSNPDAPPPHCPVNGGGPSRTPPGSCTVLAYCNRFEFRLVCGDGAATCECRTRGAIVKTVPNDRDFCASVGDAGISANIEEANIACGWNLDTSALPP